MRAILNDLKPDDDDRPFTPKEIRELRGLLEKDRRAEWFAATLRVWGSWIGGAFIGILVLHEKIRDFFRGLFAP